MRSTQCRPRLMFFFRLYVESVTFCEPMNATRAVDDEELAVVAQIGALVLALERLHRAASGATARPSR